MSARKYALSSSLELLLDTICNMFGGILFISLLVVILLNLSGENVAISPPNDVAQAKLVEKRDGLTRLQKQLDDLEVAISLLEDYSAENLDTDAEALLATMALEESRYQQSIADRNSRMGAVANSQAEINQIIRGLQEMQDKIDNAETMIALLQTELQEEIEARRLTEMPAPVETTNAEVPLFLRSGYLHCGARAAPDGSLSLNSDDIIEEQDGRNVSYAPKPGAGIQVNPDDTSNQTIEALIRSFDSRKHFFMVVVWPDSFRHFGPVQALMARHSFMFRLIPVPRDLEAIPVSVATDAAVKVQGG